MERGTVCKVQVCWLPGPSSSGDHRQGWKSTVCFFSPADSFAHCYRTACLIKPAHFHIPEVCFFLQTDSSTHSHCTAHLTAEELCRRRMSEYASDAPKLCMMRHVSGCSSKSSENSSTELTWSSKHWRNYLLKGVGWRNEWQMRTRRGTELCRK
jgi:hypothetical protein